MADELAELFRSITTSDHDDLIRQFARVLRTDEGTAKFFLESSAWNVEAAANNFLGTLGGEGGFSLSALPAPQAAFLGGTECLSGRAFPPGARITMSWVFRNTGPAPWPPGARLVHVEGERLGGPSDLLVAAAAGHDIAVSVSIVSPPTPGSWAGTWRLACSTGYFSDPIWVILTVAAAPLAPLAGLAQAQQPPHPAPWLASPAGGHAGPGTALVAPTVPEDRAPRGLPAFVAPHTTAPAPFFTAAGPAPGQPPAAYFAATPGAAAPRAPPPTPAGPWHSAQGGASGDAGAGGMDSD